MAEPTSIHRVVQELVQEIEVADGGATLTDLSLDKWVGVISVLPPEDRQTVGLHLIVFAMRLRDEPEAEDLIAQLSVLAVAAATLTPAPPLKAMRLGWPDDSPPMTLP